MDSIVFFLSRTSIISHHVKIQNLSIVGEWSVSGIVISLKSRRGKEERGGEGRREDSRLSSHHRVHSWVCIPESVCNDRTDEPFSCLLQVVSTESLTIVWKSFPSPAFPHAASPLITNPTIVSSLKFSSWAQLPALLTLGFWLPSVHNLCLETKEIPSQSS